MGSANASVLHLAKSEKNFDPSHLSKHFWATGLTKKRQERKWELMSNPKECYFLIQRLSRRNGVNRHASTWRAFAQIGFPMTHLGFFSLKMLKPKEHRSLTQRSNFKLLEWRLMRTSVDSHSREKWLADELTYKYGG